MSGVEERCSEREKKGQDDTELVTIQAFNHVKREILHSFLK